MTNPLQRAEHMAEDVIAGVKGMTEGEKQVYYAKVIALIHEEMRK